MRLLLCLISLCFVITSCSSVAHIALGDSSERFAPSNPDRIETYATTPEKSYTIIGEVIVNADAFTADYGVELLREEAAKLGADGIVNMRIEISYGYWTNFAVKATGTAVRFN
jgi:hypothetical protein